MGMLKYKLEYTFKTSPKLVYQRLSTPGGLSEWFADKVTYINKNLAFEWNGSVHEAEILSKKANDHIRLKWLDDDQEQTYFEFKIAKDELTRDVSLLITDFADETDVDDSKDLWDKQISNLKRALGL